MGFFRRNWFLLGILVCILSGLLVPSLAELVNSKGNFSSLLVIILFLVMGYSLPSESILSGIRNWKLHLYIQVFIFILTPLYFLLMGTVFRNVIPDSILAAPFVITGIYALSCLPTTVSSCTVFTQISEGNTVGTMFNASLANILGIFLSPLILSWLLRSTSAGLSTEEILAILKDLVFQMLLPILAGQLVRRFSLTFANSYKKKFSLVSNICILLIVLLSIAKAAANPDFSGNLKKMLLPFLFLAVSHLILLVSAALGAVLLKFPRADFISVLYAAPQKTLAMGAPLLTAYFASRPELLGLALLPLLFYHPWQLITAGFVKGLLARPERRS